MSDETPHIIILGAGLIGLCTAYFLREKGAQVTVIDAKDGPCQGASFSNSGMIHPSQARSWAPDTKDSNEMTNAARAVVELGQRSVALLRPLMQSFGLPPRPDGCVQLYTTLDAARAAQASFNEIGIHADVLLDPIESLNEPACLFPNDMSGNAHEFGCALAADLERQGVEFHYAINNFAVRQTDGDKLKVMVGDERLTCDHVVLAAGSQTAEVLARHGLRMQLDSVSGMAINFERPDNLTGVPSRPIMDSVSRTALTLFDDTVRISGGWNESEPGALLKRWKDIAPNLIDQLGSTYSVWTGYRPVSPVGRPYISHTSQAGLWINTGHGHMGWTLCAASGELMAEMILEGRQDNRFAFVC